MSRHLGWRLLAVIVLLGAAGALVLARPARLGLDLRGPECRRPGQAAGRPKPKRGG
jgi:hypothetical protein